MLSWKLLNDFQAFWFCLKHCPFPVYQRKQNNSTKLQVIMINGRIFRPLLQYSNAQSNSCFMFTFWMKNNLSNTRCISSHSQFKISIAHFYLCEQPVVYASCLFHKLHNNISLNKREFKNVNLQTSPAPSETKFRFSDICIHWRLHLAIGYATTDGRRPWKVQGLDICEWTQSETLCIGT